MSSKKFELKGDTLKASTSQSTTTIDWDLCVICQQNTSESLISPLQSKRKSVGKGYHSLAENLMKFKELGNLPKTLQSQLDTIDEGQGIETALVTNKAKWHKTCVLRYNNQMLQRAIKRERDPIDDDEGQQRKSIRLQSSHNQTEAKCFFCGKEAGNEGLHEVTTTQVEKRVRECTELTGDTLLLAKLGSSDMIALEAKYHIKCLLALYNRARKVRSTQLKTANEEDKILAVVFAELVVYIEDARSKESIAPVFKLADMAQLYRSRLQQLGVISETRMHTTRLKQKLLARFPDMRAHSKGRDILLAFDEDVGHAINKACEYDDDDDAILLARATQIVRRNMFDSNPFTGSFNENCQEKSVPPLLIALVNMVLEGPNIKDQMCQGSSQAALSIAQIMKYNSAKNQKPGRLYDIVQLKKPHSPFTLGYRYMRKHGRENLLTDSTVLA